MGKYLSVLFTLIFIYSDCQATCPAGFFGSWCQYKCHCAEKCDDSGACIGQQPSCAKGWFGLGCQYEDIAVNAELLLNGAMSSTKLQAQCVNIGNITTLTLSWSTSQVFTWMRIQILDTDILKNFTVTFLSGGRTLDCAEQKILQIDKKKYNIYCQMKVAITQITLSGEAVKSICSVHVSGGRNLALKQQTSQTSTHLNYESQFAVDGIVAPSCRFSGCSHTAVYDTTPSWSVTFNQVYSLNRFVLYNRLDSSTFRLKYFGLQVLDEKHSVIFNYTDTNHSNNQSVYTVLYPDNKPAAIVTVVQTHMNDVLDAVPYVSLNEFEAYGECVPGRWGLDCNELCPAHCQNSCSSENGSCSFICIGYSNPPNCTKACQASKWGTNCTDDCSTSCLTSVCDSSNGNCLSGCLGFSNPPVCTQECTGGYYGINCSDKCSDRCLNSLCNKTFGQCLACHSGFIGDDCNTICSPGTYGNHCDSNCSSHCLNNCNNIDGQCSPCKPGYQNLLCDQECFPKRYGPGCSFNCSFNCRDNLCDPVSGRCYECPSDRYGDFCDECLTGYYGILCANRCSIYCESSHCNRLDGWCSSCKSGYMGPKCDQVCKAGKYGQDCLLSCSHRCKDSVCDPVNGSCVEVATALSTKKINDSDNDSSSISSETFFGIGFGSCAGLGLLLAFIYCLVRRKRKSMIKQHARAETHVYNTPDTESNTQSTDRRLSAQVLGLKRYESVTEAEEAPYVGHVNKQKSYVNNVIIIN